ncbi:MAG: HU family DNA-binding protein [Acidobacteria bacterium]|jgi:DNA-binding protein HU-beta|nr:HU family DNA-binding protein [Acidobacteriota bacterium]
METKKNDSTKTIGGAAKKAATSKTAAPATTGGKEKSVTELVSALADKTGITKAKVKEILDAHAELLVNELQSAGSVQLAGIGKLKLGQRAERQGRNPSTGEAITIKASKTVKFSGGKRFKDSFQ